MKNKFEDDELLSKLSKAARQPKAPLLSDKIIYSAVDTDLEYAPRKLSTPRLLVSLVGGAAVLAGVFLFFSPGPVIDVSTDPIGEMASNLIIRGELEISENDLLFRKWATLAEFGQSAVGNYISNCPTEYVDETWNGQGGYNAGRVWVFVVTDNVYFPNSSDFGTLFSEASLSAYRNEIASRSDADGIRLLIQGSNEKLYPLVIPETNKPNSLYAQVLDKIESNTFTKVPKN